MTALAAGFFVVIFVAAVAILRYGDKLKRRNEEIRKYEEDDWR